MSIDNNSETVRSKYFTLQCDMDESLSDFQEAKQSYKGPKPAQKPVKPKARKVTKRIKGQKDIRTALKEKKNELVSYTKEFDTVCKKSGLDVDSEQLQLAIALSKSLETESTSNSESSQSLSSQQRVAKIRKTLQEYGFKVPETKITASKKNKKYRKQYKLLTVTEEEKHQNITRKYSQILFESVDHSKLEQNSSINQDSDARVFHIAASISYECMKDDNIFYVDDLVEKSITNGSLLRDWSEIPGRPESPNLINTNIMNFKEIDCSQDELDVILSGPIKSVKDIFASKQIEYEMNKKCDVPKIIIEDDNENKVSGDNTVNIDDNDHESMGTEKQSPFHKAFERKSPVKKVFDMKSPVSEVIEMTSPIKQVVVNNALEDVVVKETKDKLTVIQQCRSCSPDIFDDELSSIIDNTKPMNILSQEHKTKVFSQDNFMDLTQCAYIPSESSEKRTQLSQDVTKRRSNDFMEITKCIVSSSQPIREELKEIDLTQSPEVNDAIIEVDHTIIVHDNIENLSLNLFPKNVKDNPIDSISQNITHGQNVTVLINDEENANSHKTAKDNIDLTQSSNDDDKIKRMKDNSQTPDKKEVESMDLTQSSNSNDIDDLPLVVVANSQTENSLDDTIIINKEEYMVNGKVKKSVILANEAESQVFDLTQAYNNSTEYNPSPVLERNAESCSNSFYEDFVHDHSENTENSNEIEQDDDNDSSHNESQESNDIDLTQGSDTSEEIHMSQRPITALENVPNNSSLGKREDVSIDYDEVLIDDDICEKDKESENDKSLSSKYDSPKSEFHNDIEIVDINNDVEINSSQNSEVFNISDNELDYSLHKSRHDFPRDNFDFGGISVLDNATKLGSFRKSLSEGHTSNKNISEDSFLPDVYIKRTIDREEDIIDAARTDIHKHKEMSPIKIQEVLKSNNGIIHIKTPNKSEYIIKTENVTPMPDYASMSTPQRNRELDRYGFKRFKRKRAVRILTHIYNQTHPTIQLVEEDQPSPCKKRRTNTYTPECSPKKLKMSPKNSPSTKMRQNTNISILASLQKTPVKSPTKSPLKKLRKETTPQASPRKSDESERDRDISSASSSKTTDELKGMIDVNGYEVTSEGAVLKSVVCCPEDWVFQKREKAKAYSCRVPLHIAFHNYVLSRHSLREAILKYEPVNIDVIHKDLVGYGHRYDPKDLLKFLDKKCITVKTTDNNSRNNKR